MNNITDIEKLDFYSWTSGGMVENSNSAPLEDVFLLRSDVLKILKQGKVSDVSAADKDKIKIEYCYGEAIGGHCAYPDKSCGKRCEVSSSIVNKKDNDAINEDLEGLAEYTLREIEEHSILCKDEIEENIFCQGFFCGYKKAERKDNVVNDWIWLKDLTDLVHKITDDSYNRQLLNHSEVDAILIPFFKKYFNIDEQNYFRVRNLSQPKK